MTVWKEHLTQIRDNPRNVDVESLYAIIDRLLPRIEELEAQLEKQ